MPAILNCILCEAPLEILGKHGDYIHTHCSECGMDSSPMIIAQAQQPQVQKKREPIEVVHRKTLPPSAY